MIFAPKFYFLRDSLRTVDLTKATITTTPDCEDENRPASYYCDELKTRIFITLEDYSTLRAAKRAYVESMGGVYEDVHTADERE